MTDPSTLTDLAHPRPAVRDREGTTMLLHEALARCRQHEAEQAAREHALGRSLTAGRRWALIARFAARRAACARSDVPRFDRGAELLVR